MTPDTLQYRAATVESASPVQLVCMLYDTVVRDLSRAVLALEKGDVETRTLEVKHALLVIQQLEAFLDMQNGGATAQSVSQFYAIARSRILEGHAKMDSAIFQQQITFFLDLRSAWDQAERQQKEKAATVMTGEAPASASLSCSV